MAASPIGPGPHPALLSVSRGYSEPRGRLFTCYSPLRRSPLAGRARLACLIHVASVHSEPGSNSPLQNGARRRPRALLDFSQVFITFKNRPARRPERVPQSHDTLQFPRSSAVRPPDWPGRTARSTLARHRTPSTASRTFSWAWSVPPRFPRAPSRAVLGRARCASYRQIGRAHV